MRLENEILQSTYTIVAPEAERTEATCSYTAQCAGRAITVFIPL